MMGRTFRNNANLCLFLVAAIVGLPRITHSLTTCSVSDGAKRDCGYFGIDQNACESRSCCWSPAGTNSAAPWCYYSEQESSAVGYSLSQMTETETGYHGTLNLRSTSQWSTSYGADIASLSLDIFFETTDTVRVRLTDASNSRWEIPESLIARSHAATAAKERNYKLQYTASPFSFTITRASDGATLFSLDSNSFVFTNQFIQVSTSIDPAAQTYGIGESARLSQALTPGSKYTLWAADVAALTLNNNLYGAFPYYVQMVNGLAHGVLMFNSNGMDVALTSSDITFKMIGGVVDLYVFTGSSPREVVAQYTQIIGRPAMMPYWSLGFHNCKYGYTSIYQVEEVVANYSAANIPLDTQWMDIDYMEQYRDFTIDSVNFPLSEVRSFVDQLHKNGQHFVPIVDPGIMVYKGYDAYEKGLANGLFVKDITGASYLGQVWPGPTHFPDFFNPEIQSYWDDQLKTFHDMVEYDGIWIDMNEAANFCNTDGTGQVCANTASGGCPAPGSSQTDCCLSCKTIDGSNTLDYPPYAIGNIYGKLGTKTMAMSATHYGDVAVYDAHNLYGLSEQKVTATSLKTVLNKRPFILTRSSFVSTGVHSAKWTGDNGATWNDLKSSIISVTDFSLFGVPMVGADVCGFIFDTTEELCSRWIEVGAFYPFVRDHNTLGAAPQELYLWDNVAAAARSALGMRYTLLPYLYTLFYKAQTAGDLVTASLWMNFPSDKNCIGLDSQFMWGDAVLFSPVLEAGATSVRAYFPQGQRWYTLTLNETVAAGLSVSPFVDTVDAGEFKSLYTPLTATNIHLRGGSILPVQQAAMTTSLARRTPFSLVAAICPYGKAFGKLFWDDGEQVDLRKFITADYEMEVGSSSEFAGVFKATVVVNTFPEESKLPLNNIVVAGLKSGPTSAALNGSPLSAAQVIYDATSQTATFSELALSIGASFQLTWK